jgi:benzoylformate decarboxylase
MEPLLYGPMLEMARPLVKWAVEVTRLEDLPRIVRRAAKIATTPPMGPVFISLPGDILNLEGAVDLMTPTRVHARVAPDQETRERLVELLVAAERPVIVVGDEIVKSDAWLPVEGLAELLGAPVYQQSIAYGAHFRSEHPLFMGALTRQQASTRKLLEPYDLLIALGTDPVRMSVYSPGSPMPEHLKIVQIGLDDWDIGKNFPVALAINADVGATLSATGPMLDRAMSERQVAAAEGRAEKLTASNWSSKRARLAAEIRARPADRVIDPDQLALALVEALPRDAILVDESLTSGRYIPALYAYRDRYAFHGLASGGIGWGLPAAVGASLANPHRRVAAFIGDGSAMYSIQALWTAAHHKLPLTVVIPNNGGYRIIKQRLTAFHGSTHYVGMDFKDPPVDYVGLAMAMGVPAERVTKHSELDPSLNQAMRSSGPALVEVVVDPSI